MKNLLDKIKNPRDKKTLTLSLVAAVTLLIVVIGATYAYYKKVGNENASSRFDVGTNTTDNLSFAIDKDIEINVNPKYFGKGGEDASDTATATATLIANNKNNHASAKYNIYFIIDANEIDYTTDEHIPELLLNVKDPNGNKVENITGLKYTPNGFDITKRDDGFLIVSDYDIETEEDGKKVQSWEITVTFANLDSDQNKNMKKDVTGKIYITKEKLTTYELANINNIVKDTENSTYNRLATNLNVEQGTHPITKYYFGIEEQTTPIAYNNNGPKVEKLSNTLASKDTVTYYESDTPSYTFKGLKSDTNYIVYSYAVDNLGFKSNVYETVLTTNEYINAVVNNITYSSTLYSISITGVDVTVGSTNVVEYCYSKDNGANYTCTTSNTHEFKDLHDTTEYKIKVKVKDQENKYSTEYYKAISTVTYINPSITNVTNTKTYNSITLTPTGKKGTNDIAKYQYSLNGGAYQDSNVFTGLTEQTNYNFKVKAIDTLGRESVEYTLTVRTDAYKIPTISNVGSSSTYNSISLTVTASNGDGTIEEYCYSKNNETEVCKTTNTHTFSDLTSDVPFTIKVRVKDNNGRYSSVWNGTVRTQKANFSNTTQDVTANYDGNNKGLTISLGTTGATIYYSTSSLTTSNYKTSGSTTAITRTDAGTTTVYWCAEKSGYNVLCTISHINCIYS